MKKDPLTGILLTTRTRKLHWNGIMILVDPIDRHASTRTLRLSSLQSLSSRSFYGSVLENQGETSDSSRVSAITSVNSHMSNQNLQTRRRPSTVMNAAQVNRWNMQSRRLSLQHQQSNMSQDSNRDGLQDLAFFLMTNEPPSSSWTSHRSDDDNSAHSINNSAIKIFTRRRKTRSKSSSHTLLQLPDSAVSAKTSRGVRHIAISIPIEYDYLENHSSQPETPPAQRPQPQRIVSEKGAVTVLKPVVERREFGSSSFLSRGNSEVDTSRSESRQTPPAKLLEATPHATENSLLDEQPSRIKSAESVGLAPRSHIPVNSIDRTNSFRTVRTDPRHSGGSAYSNATITSQNWSPRGPSNASLSSPPARSSSKFSFPKTLGPADFTQIGGLDGLVNINTPEDQPQLRTPVKTSFEIESSETGSPGLPTVFSTGTAKIIRSYSAHGLGGGPRLVGSMTPITPVGPAPTRELPKIPNQEPRPSSAPLLHARSISTQALQSIAEKQRCVPSHRPITPRETQQARKEHVRAKKQRDIEKLRQQRSSVSLRSGPIVSNEIIEDPIPTPTFANETAEDDIPTPPRNPRRSQSTSSEILMNTMTSIMVVANLEPVPEEQPPLQVNKHSSSTSNSPNINRSNTSPQTSGESLSECDSDTLTTNKRRSHQSSMTVTPRTATPSISGSDLQSRRKERRAGRNTSTRERDIDARLERIEKDNQRLIEALSGIARGIGELGSLGVGRKLGLEEGRGRKSC